MIIKKVFEGLEEVETFVDDVGGGDSTIEEQIASLREVFSRCRQNDIKLKPPKCLFFRKQLDTLGFELGEFNSGISNKMLEKIERLECPKDKDTPHAQLSLFSFARDYVKNVGKLHAELAPHKVIHKMDVQRRGNLGGTEKALH